MELWGAYGGRSEYLKAPRLETLKVRLILQTKHALENEQAEEHRRQMKEQADAWERMTQGQHT